MFASIVPVASTHKVIRTGSGGSRSGSLQQVYMFLSCLYSFDNPRGVETLSNFSNLWYYIYILADSSRISSHFSACTKETSNVS